MISAANLRKTFRLYHDPKDRLKEIILRRPYSRKFEALKGISFSVKEGETLGIIGENGAGKSTLLKILTGVLLPTEGEIHVDGRITGVLELGTGFNAELTGMRNIYMNGLLIGMRREEIDREKQGIVEFAELGKFVEEPIKTYSSGMLMRLAFSIAIHAEPKVFVVDEALSVGDAYFQQKCMRKIREFREKGGSIIFVSHDMNAVKALCDRALLLNQGEVLEEGSPEQVVNVYNFLLARRCGGRELEFKAADGGCSYGSFRAEILDVSLTNQKGDHIRVFQCGETARVRITVKARDDIATAGMGVLIRDRFGQDIFGTRSYHLDRLFSLAKGETATGEFSVTLNLGSGKYTVSAGVTDFADSLKECYHRIDQCASFEVVGSERFVGIARLPVSFELDNIQRPPGA